MVNGQWPMVNRWLTDLRFSQSSPRLITGHGWEIWMTRQQHSLLTNLKIKNEIWYFHFYNILTVVRSTRRLDYVIDNGDSFLTKSASGDYFVTLCGGVGCCPKEFRQCKHVESSIILVFFVSFQSCQICFIRESFHTELNCTTIQYTA